MNKLEALLREKAAPIMDKDHPSVVYGAPSHYSENVNDDAISGDDWLENRTSYIWKVGVLSVIDGKKCDWAHLFIGHLRDDQSEPEFIGVLYWQDGENDDIGRCLRRYLKCLDDSRHHPVFDDD